MNLPEYAFLRTISEVAVLQAETPTDPDGFAEEFPGLGEIFRRAVKVYWMFPESSDPYPTDPFPWKYLTVQPVPFRLQDPKQRNGNWQWLQDPFLVLEGQRPLFMLPAQADIQDQLIVLALAKSCGAQIRMAETHFEGGNALWMGQKLLLGKDTILYNQPPSKEGDPWEIREKVELDFDPTQVGWIGDEVPLEQYPCQPCGYPASLQPFFHLDLFMMPAGVNSLGNPRIALGHLDDELTYGQSRDSSALIRQIREQLRRIEIQIRDSIHPQTEIIKVPLLLHLSDQQPRIFSPCNGLFESTSDGDRVILPDYCAGAPSRFWMPRLRMQQEKIRRIWHERGVRVEWMANGFFEDVERCGALHCRVKIIRRQTESSPWK